MLKLIMKTEVAGHADVELFQTSWGYAVRYGLQSSSHASLGVALTEFTECAEHAMACAGLIEDE